jgi:LmbE family N-acetylglucosaminyl deacetylase
MNVTSAISKIYSRLQILPTTRIATKTVVLIVAHPNDETLWAGGTIMMHPSWRCFVVCLCRGNDKERASRFHNALKILKAEGIMGDLDDGPEQKPLDEDEVERTIIGLIPPWHFDLLITHSPSGEKHIRHGEISKAVNKLWHSGKLSASELWTFAFEDGSEEYYPQPIEKTPVYQTLSKRTWFRKFRIITRTYGFKTRSFEARSTSPVESFWQFKRSSDVYPYSAENYLRMK